ncbi:MAG: aminotransferase class V-fold PLP-dependent enzyme, partial [Gemmataceae bacterium]
MAPDRRGFLQTLATLPGVGGVMSWFAAPGQAADGQRRDVYRELGVRPLINAAGTYTSLTGSLMPAEVVEAIRSAASQFVHLGELQEAVGKKIAARIGCEAALVTAGAASALTLGTAACVTGSDRDKIRRIPDTAGMKNEVIIQKSHHFDFDHALRNVGVKFVDVETEEDVKRAVTDKTAMMFFLNHEDPVGKIHAEEFARLGKKLGVPTFNDAAADVPPVENLTRFLKMGFDLVCFSGGKGLRGPQSAGLLLGRKDLIESAALNNNPHSDSVCRTNKVGKEELVGMWAAVDWFLNQDPTAMWREWERRVAVIADAVKPLDGVKTEMFVPPIANHVPHLRITWDAAKRKLTPIEAGQKLRDGEPAIEVRPGSKEALEVAVWMLEPGEDKIVARRIREVLGG